MRRVQCQEPKTSSKRFNSQGRRNTLPIWVYNLAENGLMYVADVNEIEWKWGRNRRGKEKKEETRMWDREEERS